ncbi:hypothetical protein EBB59_10705 [Lysobacter pythonis]|uniref:SF4 helicase domain-containing protein n=1 Tax=Solilutibacter pythonis TaxID=2483112 RepID=A0A3M2HQ70_9GAMM|nr:hypothetical protein EBB59_10705 [Lysobacter pythonis]
MDCILIPRRRAAQARILGRCHAAFRWGQWSLDAELRPVFRGVRWRWTLTKAKEWVAKAPVRDAVPTEAALSQWFEGLQGRYNDPFDHEFSTGFLEIDSLTAGLHPEGLVVIGGRPMSGKTALALGISQYVGGKNQGGVVFFTPESTSTLMATRLVAALSRVAIGAIRSGRDIDGNH